MFLLAFQKKPSVRTCDTPGQLLLAEPWLRSLLNRKKVWGTRLVWKLYPGTVWSNQRLHALHDSRLHMAVLVITRARETTYGGFRSFRFHSWVGTDRFRGRAVLRRKENASQRPTQHCWKRPRISDSLRSRPTNAISITATKDLDLISPPCYNYRW